MGANTEKSFSVADENCRGGGRLGAQVMPWILKDCIVSERSFCKIKGVLGFGLEDEAFAPMDSPTFCERYLVGYCL